jgi:biopolymer transport protein ExbD
MGAKVGADKGGMDEINVTPLIDIVLVLLIIFMVMTPATIQTMSNNMPPPDLDEPPPPPDQKDEQLMVAVYDDGTTALNLKPFTIGEDPVFADELRRRLRAKAKKTVFINAHPEANYGRVVNVMDLIRDAGADKVGLTDLEDEGPARLLPGQAVPGTETAAAPAPPAP